MTTKSQIRDIYKDKRAGLKKDYIIKANSDINAKLEQLLHQHQGIIGGYYPIKSEINILPCLQNLSKQGKKIALPWLDHKKEIMNFRQWKHDDVLDASQGRLSPQPTDNCEIMTPSVIIVPLITCDLHGNRIGYGKGFYDKYLDKIKKPLLVGLCYEQCLYPEKIPQDPHDCKLETVITEKQIVKV